MRKTVVFCLVICLVVTIFTPPVFAEDISENISLKTRIDRAVEWLVANQNPKGFWGKGEFAAIVDTAEIAGYLKEKSTKAESLEKAQSWLESQKTNNIDYMARVLPFIREEDKKQELLKAIISSQKADGGWGVADNFESDVLDTVLVINSLLEENELDLETVKNGVIYLVNSQNEKGGWAYVHGGEASVMLTSQVVLCLNKFNLKTNLTSSDIETALRKAGDFLVSKQQKDGTWGKDEERLADTLTAYRAVIKTLGEEAVLAAENEIKALQKENGSWYDSPYLTILAVKALSEKEELPHADIKDIKIFRKDKEDRTEIYSFNSYEELEAEVISEYDNSLAKQVQFIKGPHGNILYSEVGDSLSWNTMTCESGIYTVIAQVKEDKSGKVIKSFEKTFLIKPSFNIRNIVMTVNPRSTNLNKAVTVDIRTAFYVESNVDKQLKAVTSIYDADGNLVDLYENTLEYKAAEQVKTVNVQGFKPDVSSHNEYVIRTEIFDGVYKAGEVEGTFKVQPPPPPTRIDAEQSLNKEVLYPGKDSVTLTYKLFGEGVPEVPDRDPIDLVLILDRSGSMGGTPWSKTKEAAKIIVDLILPQDRCAVIDFNSTAYLRQDFTSDKELLKEVISRLGSGGGTNIDKGIAKGMEIVEAAGNSDSKKVFMLLSDGASNVSLALEQANLASEKGITIFTLGLGGVKEELLKNIAHITGGDYRYSPTPDELVDMMTEIAGEIFDTSGRDIVVEATIPESRLKINEKTIEPAPSSITADADGNTVVTWNYDRLIMGQEKYIHITFEGENLISDTVVQLTQNTKITYYDANGTLMELELPDKSIEVNRYKVDTKIETDKSEYLIGEDVKITVNSKNLTSYTCDLTGRVEILDDDYNVIEVISEGKSVRWKPEETLSHDFSWNTADYIAGIYMVRVTWSEEDKIISTQTGSFEIVPDKDVTNKVATDKAKYYPGEQVSIIDTVYNPSTNAIARNLSIRTVITNSRDEVVWGNENTIDEILFNDMETRKSLWDTGKIEPGLYTVTSAVYGKDKLCEDSVVIELLGTHTTGYGIIGSLDVLTKEIYPTENVNMKIELSNSGNMDIVAAKRSVSIINPRTGEVMDTITDYVDLKIDDYDTKDITWKHGKLEKGRYLVVYNVELPNETVINLGSGYFTVVKEGGSSSGSGKPKGSNDKGADDIIEEPDDEIPKSLNLDLAVSISSDKQVYTKGQIITYTVKYKNMGNKPVDEFKIVAQIPIHTSIVDSGGGEVTGEAITWKISGLPEMGEGEKVYTVLVGDFKEPEVIVSNTAIIVSEKQLVNTKDDSSTINVMLRWDENGEILHKAYICGYPDKTFRPEREVTRAEVAAMFSKIMNLEIKEDIQTAYSDVSPSHWAAGAIRAATDAGLFRGYEDNTFHPDAKITRAEFTVVVAKYLKLEEVTPFEIHYSDIEGHWALNLIEEVNRYKIIAGYEDGTFRPDEKIKRSEAVTLINKMLYRGPLKVEKSSFVDVETDHWAFGHIEEASRDHILNLDDDGNEIYMLNVRGVNNVE